MRTIVIAGGNGFLGRHLAQYMLNQGWVVRVIARRFEGLPEGVESYAWDGLTYSDRWVAALRGADVLVNMAGRTVNCRYNDENKRQIIESRTVTTKLLAKAVREVECPPELWVNSSTATIYRHAEDRPQGDYDGELGKGFSVEVAKAWENAFFSERLPGEVRKIAVRTAMVFAHEPGTVLDVLQGLCRKYLGGKMGSGEQMVSWIHVEDFCRAIEWFVEHDESSGCYNLSSPNPVKNARLMRLLRELCNVGWGLPANKLMLEVGAFFMRTETELILKSRWVLPTRLLNEGFVFCYSDLEDAISHKGKKGVAADRGE